MTIETQFERNQEVYVIMDSKILKGEIENIMITVNFVGRLEISYIVNPQPLPCPRCKTMSGYQYSDLFRMSYISFHNADGKYHGGEYSDGKCLNKGVTAFCCNCGTKLPFKLIRKDFEELNPSP